MLASVSQGTAAANKALVLDTNKDVGTIRNLTIDGTFSDGNYTFDTDGNVSGLGTVGCGAITCSDQITATGFTGTLDGILGSDTAAAATVTTLDTSNVVNLNLVTDSTSSTSGALIIDGGVGIAKKLFVGTEVHCTHLSVGCKRFSSFSVSLAGLTDEIADNDVIKYLGALDITVPTGFQAVSKIVIERVVIGVTAAVAGSAGLANLQLGTADDDAYNATVTGKLEIVGAGVQSHYGGANVVGGVNVDQSITEIDIQLNTSADTILYYVPHLEVATSKPHLYLCAGEGTTTTYDAGRFNIMVEYLVL